jgi:hypothetical protein
MKITVTGNYTEMASVLDEVKSREIDEQLDISGALKARLLSLRSNLIIAIRSERKYTLNKSEMLDIIEFIDSFLD